MAGAKPGRKRASGVVGLGNATAQKNKKLKQAEETKSKVSHHSHSNGLGGCVLTVGEGDTGQLGLGPDVMERSKPGQVPLKEEVSQICSGGMHTVCLTKKGEVYTFGCNDEGALGRNTPDEDDCMEPGKVDLPYKIVQVSAGDSHSAALSEEGKVYAWGTFRDANGRIGLTPDGEVHTSPVGVFSEHRVVKVASGTDHLVCLTEDGQVYTMGCAEQGQLGRVAECFSQRGGRKGLGLLLTPGAVHCKKRRLRFCDVWTGQYVTFVQASDTGDIYSWGLNNYYQLGFNDMKNRFVPEKCKSFSADKKWREISGGQHHTLALDGEGHVYSLGRKEYGRLGLGKDVEEKKEPTQIESLHDKKCIHVNAGTAVSFAVTEGGEVYAWGMGTSKQLGQSEEDDVYEPVLMKGKQLESRKSLMVSAGGQHTALLASNK